MSSLLKTHTWRETLGYWLAWLGSCLLIGIDFLLLRSLILNGLMWLAVHQSEADRQRDRVAGTSFGARIIFADYLMVIVLSLIGLGFIIWFEYTYRRAADQGRLWQRLPKVMGIQIALALAAWLLQQFL